MANNFEWAHSSICDLYLSRWGIEVFFKQIKQTLKVCDFQQTSDSLATVGSTFAVTFAAIYGVEQ